MTMLVDQSIWNSAEDTAKSDHPAASVDAVRRLAEAWQRAYEEWAADMDEANHEPDPEPES